jgi:hypothetical protein
MAVKTTYEDPEGEDPFKDFSISEMWAYIYKTQGASGLRTHFSDFDTDWGRKLLSENNLADVKLWRELLIDKADELRRLNLHKVADLCQEEADRRLSKFDRPNEWHATEENRWRERMERERQQWERQREKRQHRFNGVASIRRKSN